MTSWIGMFSLSRAVDDWLSPSSEPHAGNDSVTPASSATSSPFRVGSLAVGGRYRGHTILISCAAGMALVFGGCGSSDDENATASVQVTAPQDGSAVGSDRVTVRGTVTPGDASVQLVGQSAQVGNGVFTGSVPLHRGKNTIDVVASAPGAAPATTTIVVTRRTGGGGGPTTTTTVPIAGPTDCGSGLTAGANTSCPFAENVRAAYNRSGSSVLSVESPVTGQTYRMFCTAGAAHVCTGGNNASVTFGDTRTYSTGNCGGGLSVGPNTTCEFGENVRAAYEQSGSSVVEATSPTTGRTYTMYCTSASPHACTGGNNAAVYFP
jgi:hypothetical protein